jgi:uncharacterized membrane protein YcaP (DUF421 family)
MRRTLVRLTCWLRDATPRNNPLPNINVRAWKSYPVMGRLDMNTFTEFLHTFLGIGTEPRNLTFMQVSVRGIIVFIATLIMVRLGSKRSLAEKTAFDAVFIVIIGSMLARAINGTEAFFPTLGTGFVLVALHRLFGMAAYYSHVFGMLVKGKPMVLVEDGRLQQRNMLWEHISKHDLEEDMRLDASTQDLSQIQVARLERSGDISFIKRKEQSA